MKINRLNNTKKAGWFMLFIFFSSSLHAILLPARIFSDNMVLQREVAIPVWGTAIPGEQITLRLGASEVKIVTKSDGHWRANLPQLPAGGPFKLEIKGQKEKIEFKNVLIGDVWFASGQSNMEHPMKGWEFIPHSAIDSYEKEIADSNYPEIRLFSVPKYPSPVEQKDLPGGKWEIAGPELVSGFSSTAWFFGKELYQKLKVPIGIIHSSWGGTPIQTWMSRESLEPYQTSVNIPAVPLKFDPAAWTEKVSESLAKNLIRRNQISYPTDGLPEKISKSDFDDSSWKSVDILNPNSRFGNITWLRNKIVIPESYHRQTICLSLGFLGRQSQVFFNGTELGYFSYPRPVKVEIPAQLVQSGENVLSIRLAMPWGETQVFGKKEQFFITNSSHSISLNLVQGWKVNDQLEPIIPLAESYQNNPAFLFNGMVAPVVPYSIKGFIWYQGESNAGQPQLYEKMFQQLIVDWRKIWNQGDLPFLFVQTSNIEQSHEFDKKSDSWCLLREAQQKALALPATGMAVSLDMGNPYDVHPKNKKEFGHRLALQAFKVAYHQDIVADGPVYESFEIKDDTFVVRIKDPLNYLLLKRPGNLSGFEIAAKNGVFQEAKASLRGNKV
jgi:sialate O-acetylesterase